MKTIFFFILISLSIATLSHASTLQTDSVLIKNGLNAISKSLVKIDSAITKQNAAFKSKNTDSATGTILVDNKSLSYQQKFLVMMPFILFILLVVFTLKRMQSAGFNFKQAFYSDEPEDVIKASPTPTDPNATIKITLLDSKGFPVYYPSTSRLIVFLTGLTTLIVIVSFITYYSYCMLKGIPLPPFKDLFEIIMGLGLGIVPYGVSRIAAATTKPNS